MKILVTGSNGFLGHTITSQKLDNLEYITLSKGGNKFENLPFPYYAVDITQYDDMAEVIRKEQPHGIIHCAALTNVERCETEKELCRKINVEAVQYLVQLCQKYGCFFSLLSTDFVFSGDNDLYREHDTPNPINYYGESKLMAEKIVSEAKIKAAIIRTSLIYGICKNGNKNNIVEWIIKNFKNKTKMKLVTDQYRMPVYVKDLAKACITITRNQLEGIFHVSGKNLVSPHDIGTKISSIFQLSESLIEKADKNTFKQIALRPEKTKFDISYSQQKFGYNPMNFEDALKEMKKEYANV